MNLPDEKRGAVAEALLNATCTSCGHESGEHSWLGPCLHLTFDPDEVCPCRKSRERVFADALAPLLAGWLAEAYERGVNDTFDTDGALLRARSEGAAEVRARVEAAVDRLDGSLGGIVAERYSIAVREALATAHEPPQEPRTHPGAGAGTSGEAGGSESADDTRSEK